MEGVIKFRCDWQQEDETYLSTDMLSQINYWRDMCVNLWYIGKLQDGTGYGNISVRFGSDNQFVITGSQTAGLQGLTYENLSLVTAFSINENYVQCRGPVTASSESLSHAVFYESNPNIKAVIHIHDKNLWYALQNDYPTTDLSYTYGTPQLALNIADIIKQDPGKDSYIIVMGGHQDGIIIGANTLKEAGNLMIDITMKYPEQNIDEE